MAENLMCQAHKNNSEKFRENFEQIFRTNQDIPYSEEIRQHEMERRLKDASNTTKS